MNEELTQEAAESIVIRIKKLVALSTSSNENEAAAAAAKAQELLIKYNVDMSRVENVKIGGQDTHLTKQFKELFDRNEIQWKMHLAFAVAKGNMCEGVSQDRGMWFLGKKHNIEVTEFMYEYLVTEIKRIAEAKWQGILAIRTLQEQFPSANLFRDRSLKTVHGKTWKASFYVGAVHAIKERLEGTLMELEAGSNETSALITLEEQRLKDYTREVFPRLYNVSGLQYNYRSAYQTGKTAGESIQFRQGIAGGTVGGSPRMLGDGKRN